jgi:hypothetical protein
VKIESIALAIREEVPGKKGENAQAAREAYNEVKYEIRSTKSETNTNFQNKNDLNK